MSSNTVATFLSKVKSRAALFSWNRTSLDTEASSQGFFGRRYCSTKNSSNGGNTLATSSVVERPLARAQRAAAGMASVRAPLKRRHTVAFLQRIDVGDHGRARVQQAEQLRVDGIHARAERLDVGVEVAGAAVIARARLAAHALAAAAAAALLICRRGKPEHEPGQHDRTMSAVSPSWSSSSPSIAEVHEHDDRHWPRTSRRSPRIPSRPRAATRSACRAWWSAAPRGAAPSGARARSTRRTAARTCCAGSSLRPPRSPCACPG